MRVIMTFTFLTVVLLISVNIFDGVKGDCYLHNPRGSNNRLAESSANRQNGNRMFDSQNNNKGGYNVGDAEDRPASNTFAKQYQMRYFESGTTGKSYLPIEWTNQHGCGKNTANDPIKLNCNMVMQYMCQPADIGDTPTRDSLRDGLRTETNRYQKPQISRGRMEQANRADDRLRRSRTDLGMNEPMEWRDKCEIRPRNKGLFTADQDLKKDSAISTRQNPNGNRNGYECPEERDYYPYWHPSDWKDIGILTEDESECDALKKASFNVQPYHECVQKFRDSNEEAHYSQANNENDCTSKNGEWREFHNYQEKLLDGNNIPANEAKCQQIAAGKNVPAAKVKFEYAIYGKQKECLVSLDKPDCKLAGYTRVNQLGNSDALKASTYQWELPHFYGGQTQKCVFRMRYNISTEDYDPKTDSKSNNNDDVIANDPKVSAGLANDQKLQLAINTAQTGRTFQDRSHVFFIMPRTADLAQAPLHNLNVRGKRGNIVQTYPAVEYDFVPNNLTVTTDEMVHIQWTGSNTHNNANPAGDGQAGDDGEGRGGTDRSNILSMSKASNNFFSTLEDRSNIAHNVEVMWAAKDITNGLTPIDVGLQLASAGYYRCLDCKTDDELITGGTMDNLLNDAPASFPGMVVKFKKPQKHEYGCTRNNNFSNRSQKGRLVVKPSKK